MSDSVGAQSGLRRRRKLKLGKKAETFLQNESFLPEDVVIDILSRLPAKDVLRSRCVCRLWRDLTSTRDFIDLHFPHSLPMILMNRNSYRPLKDYNGPILLDGCWEPGRTRSKIHKEYDHGHICLSHNGLIVSRGSVRGIDYMIYNPIYSDVVEISMKPYRGGLCRIFFHPVLQEYCTLWEIIQSFYPLEFQYKILNLESNPHWRDIENPCTPNRRISRIRHVLIEKYLYWMVEPCQQYTNFVSVNCDMIEYDIRKEEFRVIPCPASIGVKNHTYYNVNLVNTDGDVSVVQVLPSNQLAKINIWTLKDDGDGEQLWTSSNYIIINCDVRTKYGVPKAIAFRDGELVLVLDGRLYVCNLKLGTFRKFGQTYSRQNTFLSHVRSLVSLKNCRSNICIAEEDESNRIERGRGEEIQALR